MIMGIDHVAISVAVMERALEFYRDLLGLGVVTDGRFSDERSRQLMQLPLASGRVVLLKHPGSDFAVELFEFAAPSPRPIDGERRVCDHGISHFCLRVCDIDAEYARLVAKGVHFHSAPITFPSGARSVYGRDPDGNVFEIVERSMNADTRGDEGACSFFGR